MKKKNNYFSYLRILLGVLLILTLPLITNAQNYQIGFAGNGEATAVTSVIVENISQCTSLVLNEGDILNLTGTVGIDDKGIGKDNNVFIYPNPMRETCSIELEAPAQSTTTIEPPDLLIYLRASIPTLVSQISRRGRKYENNIRLDYFKRLNERYEAWVETYNLGKLLIIDADNYNFPDRPEDVNAVIDKINAQPHGLF